MGGRVGSLLLFAFVGCGSGSKVWWTEPTTSPLRLEETLNGETILLREVSTVDGGTQVLLDDTKVLLTGRTGHRGTLSKRHIDLEIESVRLSMEKKLFWNEHATFQSPRS